MSTSPTEIDELGRLLEWYVSCYNMAEVAQGFRETGRTNRELVMAKEAIQAYCNKQTRAAHIEENEWWIDEHQATGSDGRGRLVIEHQNRISQLKEQS